jgi:CheY-like chemotaxis protein
MSAAAELCEVASWALATGDAPRATSLLEAAESLMFRRKQLTGADHRSGPIIVVEDDDAIREAVSDFLIEAGYDVLAFPNGEEALDHLRRQPAAGLVLLDLMMPVMDGWTFHERFMQDDRLAKIPVVAISASGVPGPAAVRVLPKPLRLKDLLAVVTQTVESPEPDLESPAD